LDRSTNFLMCVIKLSKLKKLQIYCITRKSFWCRIICNKRVLH